jgi:hypothetical protein
VSPCAVGVAWTRCTASQYANPRHSIPTRTPTALSARTPQRHTASRSRVPQNTQRPPMVRGNAQTGSQTPLLRSSRPVDRRATRGPDGTRRPEKKSRDVVHRRARASQIGAMLRPDRGFRTAPLVAQTTAVARLRRLSRRVHRREGTDQTDTRRQSRIRILTRTLARQRSGVRIPSAPRPPLRAWNAGWETTTRVAMKPCGGSPTEVPAPATAQRGHGRRTDGLPVPRASQAPRALSARLGLWRMEPQTETPSPRSKPKGVVRAT